MLGERIRKLRKQKKMTLEALAGDKLTKGMLSLIENDKAQPSMESLNYIAEQLNVEVAELVGGTNTSELREVMNKAELIYNVEQEEDPEKYKKLLEMIEPYLNSFSKNYESARLLTMYGIAVYQEKLDGWEEYIQRAADLSDEMNLTSNRAKIAVFRGLDKFVKHQYAEALEIFLRERKAVEAQHSYIDPLALLELDYHESVLYFAVGKYDLALEVMGRAISLSKEKRIFYLINDLYRLATVQAMDVGNKEKKDYYLQKLKLYGEFADHPQSIGFCNLMELMILIIEEKQYEKALSLIEEFSLETRDEYDFWLKAEKGKALYYLGRYEEAFEFLKEVTVPDFLHHPFDLAMLYVLESYKGLIQWKLGNKEAALSFARTGVELFETQPDSQFKHFSMQTLQKIEE